MKITIRVNGRLHSLEVDPKKRLLTILRDDLGLTGTKNGCSQGHCGACTIVLNGKAVRSCLLRAERLNGTEIPDITTIEGLADDYKLHPIQEAFIETTAVQCGFCTPGIIMELYALFSENLEASEEDFRNVLEKHLCRCTGYKPLFDAALLSRKLLQEI